MPANAAIYIPYDTIKLPELFGKARSDGDPGRAATFYACDVAGDLGRLNVMPSQEVPQHLSRFASWVESLDEPAQRKADARLIITHSKRVLGLVTQGDFQENPRLWQAVFEIADSNDGFVFVYDSIYLANGAVLLGVMRETEKA